MEFYIEYVTVSNAFDCGCNFSLLVIFKLIVSELHYYRDRQSYFEILYYILYNILYYILYNIIKITLKIYLI